MRRLWNAHGQAHIVIFLLFFRALQAIGNRALSALSLTILKDLLSGKTLEKAVALMQTLTILAPMLAPILGGWLLIVMDWRGLVLLP